MADGNLVLDPGIKLCLGDCPSTMTAPGIYVGSGQSLFFPSFTLLTTGTGGNTLTLQRNDGTAVLTCDQRSCYSATVPANANTLAPGFYLTGRPGSPPLSINDPWQVLSNLDLVDGSSLQMITLQGDQAVSGWRLVVANTSYAMTNKNQLVVGNVLASTILATNSAVLAEGPVLVRNAQMACPIPLPRPISATAVLIHNPQADTAQKCDFTNDPKAFTYSVPVNTCLASPFNAVAGSALAYPFFKISAQKLHFYTDGICANLVQSATQTLHIPCTGKIWSALFFSGLPNMVG